MKKILFAHILLLAFFACSSPNYFISPSFKTKAKAHKTMAVLPFEVNNNGKVPEGMTEDRKTKITEEEAKAFPACIFQSRFMEREMQWFCAENTQPDSCPC